MHHELTVWSRGIIMDKEARDVSTCIATAARTAGLLRGERQRLPRRPGPDQLPGPPVRPVRRHPHPRPLRVREPASGLGGAGRGNDHQGRQLLPRDAGRRGRARHQLRARPAVPAEVPARAHAGQAGQARRGGRHRAGRAARQQPVDVRPRPVRAGLRPDVHRGRRGAAGHREGHRGAADRGPGGGDRRPARRRRGGGGGRPRRHAPRRQAAHGRPVRRVRDA